MNNRYMKRMLRLCVGVFFMIAVLLFLVGMENRNGEKPCLYLTEGDEGWDICLSPGLFEVAEGRSVALLITVEIPAGWGAPCVEMKEGANGMCLTVGENEEKCKILLDGLPDGEGTVLLELSFSRVGEGRPVLVGDTVALYCLEAGGEVTEITIRVDREEPEEDLSSPSETHTEETERGDVHETESETFGDETPIQQEKPPPLPWGCQETVPRDGMYAVRFLFHDTTPVICMEGGGVIPAEWGNCEGWSCVTFGDLRVDRRYVFWVYTAHGIVEVVYENGQFTGFYKGERP